MRPEPLIFAAIAFVATHLAAAGPEPAAPPAAPDAGLGTLFFSAEERARMDRQRRGEPIAPPSGATGAHPAPHVGEVTGYVMRSDGRSTVWIDGVPLAVQNSRAAPLMRPDAVRSQAGANSENLHIERRPAR